MPNSLMDGGYDCVFNHWNPYGSEFCRNPRCWLERIKPHLIASSTFACHLSVVDLPFIKSLISCPNPVPNHLQGHSYASLSSESPKEKAIAERTLLPIRHRLQPHHAFSSTGLIAPLGNAWLLAFVVFDLPSESWHKFHRFEQFGDQNIRDWLFLY